MKPQIIAAAVRLPYEGREVVLPLHRHCDFFDIAKQLHISYDKSKVEQGFIAYDGIEERFVDRMTAYSIAKDANQITDTTWDVRPLYSEDLW